MSGRAFLRAVLLAAVAGALVLPARGEEPAAGGWRPFTATWTLSGQRSLLPTGGERPASIVHLTGPLILTGGEGLGRGLYGEVIGFDDGGKQLSGRAVFTDKHVVEEEGGEVSGRAVDLEGRTRRGRGGP
jgi:hypothetical protein